jgi:hypothetical protein
MALRIIFVITMLLIFITAIMDIALITNFANMVSNGMVGIGASTLTGSFPVALEVLNALVIGGIGTCFIMFMVLVWPYYFPATTSAAETGGTSEVIIVEERRGKGKKISEYIVS